MNDPHSHAAIVADSLPRSLADKKNSGLQGVQAGQGGRGRLLRRQAAAGQLSLGVQARGSSGCRCVCAAARHVSSFCAKTHATRRSCSRIIDCLRKCTDCIIIAEPIDRAILETARNSATGWDHITQSLVAFGFVLLDTGATGIMAQPAGPDSPAQLGFSVLLVLFGKNASILPRIGCARMETGC